MLASSIPANNPFSGHKRKWWQTNNQKERNDKAPGKEQETRCRQDCELLEFSFTKSVGEVIMFLPLARALLKASVSESVSSLSSSCLG
jgi:hypothetical protein